MRGDMFMFPGWEEAIVKERQVHCETRIVNKAIVF
jgi:hypothetical protein